MPLLGDCAGCGATVLLNPDGSCSQGHPRASVTSIVEEHELAPPSMLVDMGKKVGGLFAGLKKPKSEAEAELLSAQNEYDERVSAAFASLAQAAAPWNQEVKKAKSALEYASGYGMRKVGSFHGLTLYEHQLMVPSGIMGFETGHVRVTIDTAGNLVQTQRATLTRMAAGGLLLGPLGALLGGMYKKKEMQDTRELYILVESDTIGAVLPLDPDQGPKARRFAAMVQSTANGAPARAQQREQSVAQWQRYLDDMMVQRFNALAAPRAAAAAAEADTARLDAARAARA